MLQHFNWCVTIFRGGREYRFKNALEHFEQEKAFEEMFLLYFVTLKLYRLNYSENGARWYDQTVCVIIEFYNGFRWNAVDLALRVRGVEALRSELLDEFFSPIFVFGLDMFE